MDYFKQIFEQTLKETPLVQFIKYLMSKKILNKFITIPKIDSEFDRNDIMIEYNGKTYSWFITDRKSKSDYIEKSNDTFSTYKLCIENLIEILKG